MFKACSSHSALTTYSKKSEERQGALARERGVDGTSGCVVDSRLCARVSEYREVLKRMLNLGWKDVDTREPHNSHSDK
jgi:hypothetical protein